MSASTNLPTVTPWPKPRVLLVDDEPDLLRAFERMLRGGDFIVDSARSGAEAIALLGKDDYHVVVTDVSMPGMNGVELLRAIRKHDLDTPVILVTGAPTVETAISAVEHGALHYLVKPITPETFRSCIEKAVNLYRMALLKRRALEHLGGGHAGSDRVGLEVMFESALKQLFTVYQPIVRWSAKEIAGYEALIRSKETSLPHPGALFDAADRLHRIEDLGRAIRAIAPLPMLDGSHGQMFFNLHVSDLLDETLYDPESPIAKIADRVVLEITERAALDVVKDARGRVARLREMGFRIAVDDLGAGYAGLTSFAQLEPEVVKLDMTLVRDAHKSATKQKLIASIAVLCRDMGIEVVAEGIENAEERDCVVGLGCDLLQGYLFAKPATPFPDVRW